LALVVIWIQQLLFQPTHINSIPYSEFQRPLENRFLMDRTELMSRMADRGRAAESLVCEGGLYRRGQRPRQGHRNRAEHGGAVWDGPETGASRLRDGRRALPRVA